MMLNPAALPVTPGPLSADLEKGSCPLSLPGTRRIKPGGLGGSLPTTSPGPVLPAAPPSLLPTQLWEASWLGLTRSDPGVQR